MSLLPHPAYLLTWTCKGTWLHGDDRGSVDRNHNQVDTPRLDPDPVRRAHAATILREPPAELCDRSRAVVADAIRRHCAARSWNLLAINVRTTHVHALVDTRGACRPEKAMPEFKSWATRALRESGRIARAARPWTEHGSTRWLSTERSLALAMDYVLNRQ